MCAFKGQDGVAECSHYTRGIWILSNETKVSKVCGFMTACKHLCLDFSSAKAGIQGGGTFRFFATHMTFGRACCVQNVINYFVFLA